MMRRITWAAIANFLVAFILSGGCSDNAETTSDGGVVNTNCAPGLKPMGPACVPIFDECQDDEVPMLGGGCKRVGVRECLNGWGIAGPPDWKCKPIGPPRTCLKGWEKVAGGWCEPILPKTKCPAGTMEKIGYRTCQPIGDCGTGTWGKIKATASTLFVDQSYQGGSEDGSQARPYTSISAALAQAAAGSHIAVAAGTYKECLEIQRKVTLEGRCAQLVTIVGTTKTLPAVGFLWWASGAVLRGVTVTGVTGGLWISGVSVSAERVSVRKCEGRGIDVIDGGALALYDSLVAENREAGVVLFSSKMSLERSVVRDTRETASTGDWGTGIYAGHDAGKGGPSEVTLRDCLVAGNRSTGLLVNSSKATLDRSVIRDTRETASNKGFGTGIQASLDSGQSAPSEVTLRDCMVIKNRGHGILVASSKATLDRTVVRDTRPWASNQHGGSGILALAFSEQSSASEITVHRSLVSRNREAGIVVFSSKATVDASVIRDTLGQASDGRFGVGIQAVVQPKSTSPSELTLRDSLVAANRTIGLYVDSSRATMDRTVIIGTREQSSDKTLGTGIQAMVQLGQTLPADLTLRDSLVAANRVSGIFLASSNATLLRTVVRDTLEQVSDHYGGSGIEVVIKPKQKRPSSLIMLDSVVLRNRATGIGLFSSSATVDRTVVRGTRERVVDAKFGTGIAVQVQPEYSGPSQLTLRESLVADNREVGVVLANSKAIVERCVVRNTLGRATDLTHGIGIAAGNRSWGSSRSELTIQDTLVSGSRDTGIKLLGAKGRLTRCAISDTGGDGKGQFGDGVAVGEKATLMVEDTLVERSLRAGFLFDDSGGSINRCLIRRNVFAIDLENGAKPTIGDDNQIVENQLNHVTIGRGLKTAPLPDLPDLPGSP